MPNFRPSLSGNFLDRYLSNLDPANALNTSINLNGNKLIGIGYPTSPTDAATKQYVDDQVIASGANVFLSNLATPVQPNQDFDMGGVQRITNHPLPVALNDVATKDYVDNFSPLVGASRDLSNLLPTSINEHLIPSANVTFTLGSIFNNWSSLWTSQIASSSSLFIDSQSLTPLASNIIINTGGHPTNPSAASGAFYLSTGDNLIISGGSGDGSGIISIRTGTSEYNTGSIEIQSGSISNATSSLGSSGQIIIRTGNVSSNTEQASSGWMYLETGAGVGNSGHISISSGSSLQGNSGDINMACGPANNGNRGKVKLYDSTVLQLSKIAMDPPNPEEGDMYFNVTTKKFRGYDGTSWVDLN